MQRQRLARPSRRWLAQPGRDQIEAWPSLPTGGSEWRRAGRAPPAVGRREQVRGARSQTHAAPTRLDLARALATTAPDVAIDSAGHARTELEALGASRDEDAAAALCAVGAKGRAGPRAVGLLTDRELEVLRLLGDG